MEFLIRRHTNYTASCFRVYFGGNRPLLLILPYPIIIDIFTLFQINIAFIVPSFVSYLSKVEGVEKCNTDSLKIIYSRSSPLHNKTIEKVKSRQVSIAFF